jgi:hypothetical protein
MNPTLYAWATLAYELAPTLLMLSIVTVFAAYVFLRTDARYYLKALLIPVALLAWAVVLPVVSSTLGYAVPHEVPETWVYLGHRTVVVAGHKVGIEVWLPDGARTRLLLTRWSKQLEQVLDEAKAAGNGGGQVTISRKQRKGVAKGDGKGEPAEYESNLRLPSTDNPKREGM